jgi:hypothetical protein
LTRNSHEADIQFRKELQVYIPSEVSMHNKATPRGGTITRAEDIEDEEYNPMFATAAALITISKSTISEYNALCRLTTNQNVVRPDDPSQEWEADKRKLLELLRNGKKISMARIEKLIPKEGKKDDVDLSSESWHNEPSSHFKERHSDDTRMANALHYAAKGVRKMVKALPEQDS